MLRAYFGHHKCASSWAGAISAHVSRELGLRHAIVYEIDPSGERLADRVARRGVEFLTYANADIEQVKDLGPLRGFHIVRDPRDVMVSAYFSHLYTHPTEAWPALIEHRRALEQLDPEEGLLLEMKFRERQMKEMYSWDYSREDILELRMEDAVARPYSQMLEVISFLQLLDPGEFVPLRRIQWLLWKAIRRVERETGVPLRIRPQTMPAERVLGIVWEHAFAKKSGGRKPGQEDARNHYRKGLAGDWRNHFTPRHVKFFKEHYGDLLLKLGYETHPDWS
jgi:Sulfotransferase domain